MFRICGTTSNMIIRYFNVICNGLTLFAIYLICTELSKKYNVNKKLAMLVSATFITLPLFSIFIYGDLTSLLFALLSIYFIMKYTRKQKEYYALVAAILLGLSYMLRMNSLIFIIASLIYLVLDIITNQTERNLEKIDNILQKSEDCIYIYQKTLILIIFGNSIVVIWRGRKDISNEVIFLLTIFIGGFLFQTMWEAKSRYIIPYIVLLIPIASIMINKNKKEIKQ